MNCNIPFFLIKKTILTLIISLLICKLNHICYAQDTLKLRATNNPPTLILKYSPSSLFEFNPYFQIGIEHQIFTNIYLNHEFGYAPHLLSYTSLINEKTNFLGLRFRTGLRWYPKIKTQKNFLLFLGPELLLKQETWTQNIWVSKAGGAYEQKLNVDYNKFVWGLNFLVGNKSYLAKNKFTLEVLGGFGVKFKQVQTSNLPTGSFIRDDLFFINLNRTGVFPNAVFGVKIGYQLK